MLTLFGANSDDPYEILHRDLIGSGTDLAHLNFIPRGGGSTSLAACLAPIVHTLTLTTAVLVTLNSAGLAVSLSKCAASSFLPGPEER